MEPGGSNTLEEKKITEIREAHQITKLMGASSLEIWEVRAVSRMRDRGTVAVRLEKLIKQLDSREHLH